MFTNNARNREVARFRSATSKDHFVSGLTNKVRHDVASILNSATSGPRSTVHPRRISNNAVLPGRHGLGHFVEARSAGTVVEVVGLLAHAW